MSFKMQLFVFGIMVAISFLCLTDIEAGKFVIDFDQPNGKPESLPVGGGFDWTPLQGEWTVKNNKYLQKDLNSSAQPIVPPTIGAILATKTGPTIR